MKILIILIVLVLIVAVAYHYSSSSKDWFNAKGEYSEFPFAFQIFNRDGYQILMQDREELNSVGLSILLKTLSPSMVDSTLPRIGIYKNVGKPEDVTNHETATEIVLDSKPLKMADLGSGLHIYTIAVPLESGYFSIVVSGPNQERIDEVLNLIQKSFKFKN